MSRPSVAPSFPNYKKKKHFRLSFTGHIALVTLPLVIFHIIISHSSPSSKVLSGEEHKCEQHFCQTYERNEQRKFVVSMPLKLSANLLAEKQLINFKRGLAKKVVNFRININLLSPNILN